MFVSILEGKILKPKGVALALLLNFQGMSDLSFTVDTDEIDIKADIHKTEKESIKAERAIQTKGASFVNNDNNIAVEDDEQKDPTYSPTSPIHALASIYPCEHCGKHFKSQRSVEAHSKKHLKKEEQDDQEQTFDCTICSKIVSSKYSLSAHMKSHNKNAETIDRALCNICSKSFANKYILKSHIQAHSEENRPTQLLPCDVCFKSFSNKYLLKYHKKNHDAEAKEKTSLCNICSKLMSKEVLRKHMKHMHGENKHIPCSNCGLNYRISSIISHQKLCKFTDEEREARKAAMAKKCDRCEKVLCNTFKLRKHMEMEKMSDNLSFCCCRLLL